MVGVVDVGDGIDSEVGGGLAGGCVLSVSKLGRGRLSSSSDGTGPRCNWIRGLGKKRLMGELPEAPGTAITPTAGDG